MFAGGLQLAARHSIADPELPRDAESLPLISSSPPSNEGRESDQSEPALHNLLEENSLVDAPNSITGVAKQAVQSTATNSNLCEETEPPDLHPAGKQDHVDKGPAGKLGHGHAEIHPWYTSRQVMLTLAGYGMVSHAHLATCLGCFNQGMTTLMCLLVLILFGLLALR